MKQKPNENSLQYEFIPADDNLKRPSGGTGDFYSLPSGNVTNADFRSAINNISAIKFAEMDNMIDRTIALMDKEDSSFDTTKHLSTIYNIENVKKADISNLVEIESANPILALGGDIVTMRRSFEYYDAYCKELLPNSIDAEPYLYKVKTLDELLPKYDMLLDKFSRNRTTKLSSVDLQMFASRMKHENLEDDTTDFLTEEKIKKAKEEQEAKDKALSRAKMKRALIWLVKQNFPVEIFEKLSYVSVSRYTNILKQTMSERMDTITNYIMKGPTMITTAIHKARTTALGPLYRSITLLPAMGPEVDEVLYMIVKEAEKVFTESEKKVRELLQLTKLEQLLYERRATAMQELDEHLTFTSVLDEIANISLDDVINYVDENISKEKTVWTEI